MRNAVIQFYLRFLVNQQKAYIWILVLSLKLVPVGNKSIQANKTSLRHTVLRILSVYCYKSFNKLIVNIFASEMWLVLFKEYTAISSLCLLCISLYSICFCQ